MPCLRSTRWRLRRACPGTRSRYRLPGGGNSCAGGGKADSRRRTGLPGSDTIAGGGFLSPERSQASGPPPNGSSADRGLSPARLRPVKRSDCDPPDPPSPTGRYRAGPARAREGAGPRQGCPWVCRRPPVSSRDGDSVRMQLRPNWKSPRSRHLNGSPCAFQASASFGRVAGGFGERKTRRPVSAIRRST